MATNFESTLARKMKTATANAIRQTIRLKRQKGKKASDMKIEMDKKVWRNVQTAIVTAATNMEYVFPIHCLCILILFIFLFTNHIW